jgi:hypothetical protein
MQKVWYRSFDGWWYAIVTESGVRKQVRLFKAAKTKTDWNRTEDRLVTELAARNYSQEKAADEPSLQT